ncbi:hypothetical protein [Teredinibacter franksiae]|uniref:hypothetical protein n=1 Tax=Teredinibacter franksiae TaxID=2761453 RepID=UPI00162AD996|nr:hypothetical protein [Teredinibacter franksiae]
MIPPKDKDLLISTPNQGKEVSFAPAIKDKGIILKRAARQGYYYPMLAIKHLNALSTGLNGKRNVFIPNINDFKANTFQQVVVFVPGIMATVERRPNDNLVVTELQLSEGYDSIERGSGRKPGVYRVSEGAEGVKVDYKKNGRITPENHRNVVVADTKHNVPARAAEIAATKLEAMFSSDAALKCDFDLFYSPVGSKLGGWRNYNPIVLKEAYAFAGLLADAMEQSKQQKGVVWASELGGSVVLTQALQTLANKNISFKEQKHIIKMYQPTTNPNPTLASATKLGMIADKNLAKGNGNIRASVSSLMTNAARARDKSDPYTGQDYAKDLSNGSMAAIGAAGALATGAGLLVSSPVVTTVGSVTGAIGAIHFAVNAVKKRMKRG